MKIAQVVCVFPPYWGGIGNSTHNLAKNFSSKGEDVCVFTPDYGASYAEYGADYKIERISPLFKFGNAAVLPQLMWRLHGFNAIHLHLPFLGATLPVLWFAVFHPKIKLIITYHMDLAGSGFKKIFFDFYKKIIIPLILRRADKIIVSSYDYAESSDIKNFFAKHKNKFLEIPFGVDEQKFYPTEKNTLLAEKYFIDAETKTLLFVGGLDAAHYFKGMDILLRAVKKVAESGLENIKLVIVGDGELKSNYQNQAEFLHVRDKIIFAGGVSDAELPDYYNLADAFVLPSIDKSEAFGLVLLEAAACGKAGIASDLPGVRTVVKNNETGFLSKPADPDDLAEKIKQLLADDELRRKMGAAARSMIEKKYNWEKISQKFIDLYKL